VPRSRSRTASHTRIASIGHCYQVQTLTLDEPRPAPSDLVRNINALHGATSDRMWAMRQFAYLDALRRSPIGFVHIQGDLLHAPPLFEAYLRRPSRLSEFHVIEGRAPEQFFGVDLPYPTSGYFVPHEQMVGFCAQASCQMALANMAPYDAASLGPLDITRIALGCGSRDMEGAFDPVGLSPPQIREVLASEHSGVNAHNETFSSSEKVEKICDLLAGYVLSNCPVILSVDALAWLEKLPQELDPAVFRTVSAELHRKDRGARRHAIVVTGCSRGLAQSTRDFVVHDSMTAPYLRVKGSDLLSAARSWTSRNEVQWVAAVPKAVRVGAMGLSAIDPPAYAGELSRMAGASNPAGTRLLPRLYARSELLSSYVDQVLGFVLESSVRSDIESVLAGRCGDYAWAFERRAGQAWVGTVLFDASSDAPPYEFGFLAGNQLKLWRSKGGSDAWQLRLGRSA
jgi:hypothetical protein